MTRMHHSWYFLGSLITSDTCSLLDCLLRYRVNSHFCARLSLPVAWCVLSSHAFLIVITVVNISHQKLLILRSLAIEVDDSWVPNWLHAAQSWCSKNSIPRH